MTKSDRKSRFLKLDAAESRSTAEPQSASSQESKTGKLGQDLKQARLERNITLKQVSEDTHISLRHLESIEEGCYGQLPGGMYNRAFLRTYCVYLNLQPDKYLARYEAESAPVSEKVVKAKTRSREMPAQPIRIPPVLIWSVMLLASIAGLYFSRGWISAVFSPYFSQPPVTRIQGAQQPPAATETKAAPAQPDPGAAGGTGQLPTGQTPAQTPAATPPVPEEPPPGTMRLQFEATQDCWMSLTADGARVYYGILKPGETPQFDAKVDFVLVLGNAGGVKIKINGKPARPLGAPGAVIRQVINAETIPQLLEKGIDGTVPTPAPLSSTTRHSLPDFRFLLCP